MLVRVHVLGYGCGFTATGRPFRLDGWLPRPFCRIRVIEHKHEYEYE